MEQHDEQPKAPRPTRLRQAIDRAIARQQALEAADAQAAAAELHTQAAGQAAQPSTASAAAAPTTDQAAESPSAHAAAPAAESTSADADTPTLPAPATEDQPDIAAEDAPTHAAPIHQPEPAAEQPELWPTPPQLPQPRRRKRRYRLAAARAQQRDRAQFAPIIRTLEPVDAASLGYERPNVRPRQAASAPAEPTPSAQPAATAQPVQPAEAASAPVAPAAAKPAVAAKAPTKPLAPDVAAALSLEAAAPPEIRRPPLWIAVAAGVGWAAMLAWMLFGQLGPAATTLTRMLYLSASIGLGLVTWVPVQWALRLKALTWRGTIGWTLVLWCLAFVQAPQRRITGNLPELPVYLLFLLGVFLALSAVVMPILYLRSIRRSGNRRTRFDTRRPQRQANEVALFIAVCLILAAMNVLELTTVLLVVAILTLSELLLLSLQRT